MVPGVKTPEPPPCLPARRVPSTAGSPPSTAKQLAENAGRPLCGVKRSGFRWIGVEFQTVSKAL